MILYGSETLFQAKNLIRIGQRTLGDLILATGDKEEAEEWQGKSELHEMTDGSILVKREPFLLYSNVWQISLLLLDREKGPVFSPNKDRAPGKAWSGDNRLAEIELPEFFSLTQLQGIPPPVG